MDTGEVRLHKIGLRQVKAELKDIPGCIEKQLAPLEKSIRPGMRVGVAAGSRGIGNIALIVRVAVDCLRQYGAMPFIFPAMGSHGGATSEGQREVLASYGICEESMGVPVLSSMEVVRIGSTEGQPDLPVYMDKNAWESDGVLVINRVKPHTDFHGDHESGIVKMLTIGLGKDTQAVAAHGYGVDGLRDSIPRIAGKVIESGKILGALAILEDGYDNTSDIVFAGTHDEFFRIDRELLKRSRAIMARLPFDRVDVLVVDCMGKNYSGTGLDTNVIGRMGIRGQRDALPECARIVTLDLSDESHGNATGVGLSDIVSRRLERKINWDDTNTNIITSGFLERGFLPLVCETDREAVSLALATCGGKTPGSIRFIRIRNTLDLKEIWLSPALLNELPEDLFSGVLASGRLEFDENGCISDF